jgi:hypothetical protein
MRTNRVVVLPWARLDDPQLHDPSLTAIKQLIASKSPSEILAVRNEIELHIKSLTQRDINMPTLAFAIDPRAAADRDRLSRHRRELAFLNAIIDGRVVRAVTEP